MSRRHLREARHHHHHHHHHIHHHHNHEEAKNLTGSKGSNGRKANPSSVFVFFLVKISYWQRSLQKCKGGSSIIPSKEKFLDFFYVWLMSKLKNILWNWHEDKSGTNLLTTLYVSQPVHDFQMSRRHLREARHHHHHIYHHHNHEKAKNLTGSKGSNGRKANSSSVFVEPDKLVNKHDKSDARRWPKWIFTLIIPITVSILIIIMALIGVYKRSGTSIYAWRIRLIGAKQNAFITDVPKLSGEELEEACMEFSSILMNFPHCTLFKGNLSNGLEVGVVSINAKSQLDWSKKSESQFRNKIDAISKLNHKNFVNLISYCHENDPFMRMLVFDLASNGTLYESLHARIGAFRLERTRMRIIMGIAYCLQYLHDLKPAVVHPILHSNCIFLTEDYVAKIGDIGIFSEPLGKENDSFKQKKSNSMVVPNSPENNIYSFGILLLEIISGRMPISEDDGIHILDWAMDQMKENNSINSLVDPTLMSYKDDELQIICKVGESCIQKDPNCRPTMKEVCASLKEVLGIEPEADVPRPSLWWAELELLSDEAS